VMKAKITNLAKAFAVPHPDAIFIVPGEADDSHNGHALIEVINPPLFDSCCKALRHAPDLRQGPVDLVFSPVVFEGDSGKKPSSRNSESDSEAQAAPAEPKIDDFLALMIKDRMLAEDGSCTAAVQDAILDIMEAESLLEEELTPDCSACVLLIALAGNSKVSVLYQQIATGPNKTLQHLDVCTFAAKICRDAPMRFARAFFEQGFDLRMERYRWSSHAMLSAMFMSEEWTHEKDAQLVRFMNENILKLKVSSTVFCPDQLRIGEGSVRQDLDKICHVPLASLRTRAAMILELNEWVVQILPGIDFRGVALPRSTHHLLSFARDLLLYDVKSEWIRRNLDGTAQREDQNGPELNIDQLETVNDNAVGSVQTTQFMQSLLQMESIDPKLLRTKVARGGDPQFPVKVKFEASATADQQVGQVNDYYLGSFREWLGRMISELNAKKVPVLMDSLSTETDRMILRPGPMTFPIAKMLEYVGQLVGIALRADVPIALDLLPCFWKTLVGDPLVFDDIVVADPLASKMIVRLRQITTEEAYTAMLKDEDVESPMWPLSSLDSSSGDAADVQTHVAWADKNRFADELEALRLDELASRPRMDAIRRGLRSIIPVDILSIMTWQDMELRICGEADISLATLKANTTYNSGLEASDAHIVFFWNTLESFSPTELRMFVKFACNQERLPSNSTGGNHVPPYPMKIAPPDTSSPQQSRHGGRSKARDSPADEKFIRAETCTFLVKLPQYSTQELMTKRLLASIHCREDPLIEI